MIMTSGYIPSLDGDSIYMYASGQPFSHGGDGANQTWGTNDGIGILTLRKDGFVSVEAPYKFYRNDGHIYHPELYPSFTTASVRVFWMPQTLCGMPLPAECDDV